MAAASQITNSRMFAYWQSHPGVKPAELARACNVTIHAARAALPRYRSGRKPEMRPQGLSPKTVVNTHRMQHRAWEDFESWRWVHRNVAKDAHPPAVPRKGRKVWSAGQLRTFLEQARTDRFYALWVLEASSGMRRCELAGPSATNSTWTAGHSPSRRLARQVASS
jgi:hypothetical protein